SAAISRPAATPSTTRASGGARIRRSAKSRTTRRRRSRRSSSPTASPDPKRALTSAATIGLSYIAGGAIPLSPYFFVDKAASALLVSVGLTLLALMVFGYVKARLTGALRLRGALQTVAIGGIAAAAAFAIAKAVS